jgi:signal peptidase I
MAETTVHCPHCKALLTLPVGQAGRCPSCGGDVRVQRKRRKRLWGVVSGVVAVLFFVWAFGLVRPLHVTAGSMSPAIHPGDNVLVEKITFFARSPRRGDIVVFRAMGMPPFEDGILYPKRVVGLPGDHLRLAEGKLFVNEAPQTFTNRDGEIHYVSLPGSKYLVSGDEMVVVPTGHYFVLGDNTAKSLDSRFAGFLPSDNIVGRIWFCYWPHGHVGSVR